MYTKKLLPLNMGTRITSECWTFAKTAIMETTPIGCDWVSTHFNLFMYGDGQIAFGDGKKEYAIPYYDMFDLEYIPIESYSGTHFIKLFTQWIDVGYYVMVDVNNNIIAQHPEIKNVLIHEILLYGYDEEQKVFFCPMIYYGQVERIAIDYDTLLCAFESARLYYRTKPVEKFYRAVRFSYPVMKMRLKPSYQESVTLINQALMKIYAEYSADSRTSFCYDVNFKERHESIHLGLDCLIGLKELVTRSIADKGNQEEFEIFMTANFYKLYEHRKIMCDTFLLLQKRLNIQSDIFIHAYNSYYGHIKTMKECYRLMKKIEMTGNKEELSRLLTKLDIVYHHDFQILRDIYSLLQFSFAQTL